MKKKGKPFVRLLFITLVMLSNVVSSQEFVTDSNPNVAGQIVKLYPPEFGVDGEPSCRTYTIGIGIGFIYIESTVTICCLPGIGPPPTFLLCWEDKDSEERQMQQFGIPFNVYELLVDYELKQEISTSSLTYVTVRKSTVSYHDQFKVRIKPGKYNVNADGIILLQHEIMDYK